MSMLDQLQQANVTLVIRSNPSGERNEEHQKLFDLFL